MFELYHFESCPYCRKVREKLEALDLSYVSHPSPAGSRKREFLKRFGAPIQFPLLVDSDKGIVMVESDDICNYLEKNYGRR